MIELDRISWEIKSKIQLTTLKILHSHNHRIQEILSEVTSAQSSVQKFHRKLPFK